MPLQRSVKALTRSLFNNLAAIGARARLGIG